MTAAHTPFGAVVAACSFDVLGLLLLLVAAADPADPAPAASDPPAQTSAGAGPIISRPTGRA